MEASYDIKVVILDAGDSLEFVVQASLTVQSEAQATLTKQLINKIGIFNDTQKGETFTSIILPMSLELPAGKISGETFGLQSLVNIRNLSVELEDHVSTSYGSYS